MILGIISLFFRSKTSDDSLSFIVYKIVKVRTERITVRLGETKILKKSQSVTLLVRFFT